MEENKISTNELIEFYKDYEKRNPTLVMVYTIFSLGLYFIYWIYSMNQKFEEVDDDSPNSSRGVIILFWFPVIFSSLVLIFRKLLLPEYILFSEIFEIVGWGLITFLSMKYLYDFCVSYGKVTRGSGLFWYLFLYPGYYAVTLIYFDFYYTLPLVFFPIITIAAMQAYFNKKAEKYYLHSGSTSFQNMTREGAR